MGEWYPVVVVVLPVTIAGGRYQISMQLRDLHEMLHRKIYPHHFD